MKRKIRYRARTAVVVNDYLHNYQFWLKANAIRIIEIRLTIIIIVYAIGTQCERSFYSWRCGIRLISIGRIRTAGILCVYKPVSIVIYAIGACGRRRRGRIRLIRIVRT